MAETHIIDHVEVLAAEGAALIAAVQSGSSDARIPAVPEWDLTALSGHLGKVWRWATRVVNERRTAAVASDPEPALAPDEAVAWLELGLIGLLDALRGCPADTPMWGFGLQPRTEAFWRRRQAIETVVHRVDAELAIGELAPVDPAVAADGVGEFIDVLLPRRHRGQDPPAGQLKVTAVDTGGSWTIGDPSQGSGILSGRAEDLLLVLWRRLDADAVEAAGDPAVLAGWRALGSP
jgi:uncharacterized protein (TIGR03083 family)